MRRRRPSRTSRAAFRAWLLAAALALIVAPAAAQEGRWGRTGFALDRMPIGPRAAALGGATSSLSTDPAALFVNPAAPAGSGWTAAAVAEIRPLDLRAGGLAATLPLGPLDAGVGVAYLDLGSVDEVQPDPAYGGERGAATGDVATAGETRLILALAAGPLAGVTVGAAVSYDALRVADRTTDGVGGAVGLQWRGGHGTAAATVRRTAAEETGVRGGLGLSLGPWGSVGLDLRADVEYLDRTDALLPGVGMELRSAGVTVPGMGETRLAARIGWRDATGAQAGGLGLGGGLGFGSLDLGYALEFFEPFGLVHQFGLTFR